MLRTRKTRRTTTRPGERHAARPGGPPRVGLAVFATFAAVLALAQPATAADPAQNDSETDQKNAAHRFIEEVIGRYQSAHSYRLAFTQETYWSLADTSFLSNGELLLEQPSLLAIRYDDGSRIASDGESLWVYVAQTNQFLATDVDSSDVVIDPPRLLSQYVPDESGSFPEPTPARSEGDPGTGRDAIALSLRPARRDGEPASLDVYVDARSGLVRQIVARARSGDYTRYTIDRTELDVETSPSDFVLRRPPGAERLSGGAPALR
jgi:outer membrane lipoprotein-sorting protein